ncbi:unnamed protein product [Didymodactylos carnosus]|uniref:Uncharacterized protein n=1 Tax=Didymodactylos carnosus TaxID=1234261 RepID=A0A814AL57_9BILA|nr:unnamed protein product [Didymodactylos carnosus]CAF0915782.1 unnamed protein product [Didymodactylos carnosus]CAF3679579.1 unnamed protein product [Didymodactylos carnosus]CAF3696010.1 unnamed protein product [Didymodactylos carnosus]
MAVVGLDLGNFSAYIGIARAGGIEIIANEYSDRLTPTYITFAQRTRAIGQASKAQEVTHAKNTICNFKRLLGRKYNDSFVQSEKQLNAYSIVEGNNGSVQIEVDYLNERKRFSPEQITGMMYTKLKHIAESTLSTKVVDCVVGVPCYFTDAERRAMLDAAQIAGWNCLRLLNETTAVALCYGIYKLDLPEQTEKPRLIAFVDMGYSALQTSIVAFNKGKLRMLATAFDPSLGGRDFDQIIMDQMREDFKQRYKLDSYSTAKAKLRLKAECEKTKKLMGTNLQPIPVGLECFIDDKDVNGKIQRSEFEELAKPLLDRLKNVLENLLNEAKVTAEDIESVEIVGGSTRIPVVKQIVSDIFKKNPMTTMNADESVARGCTLMCAILSPTFKVKEFKIEDCQPYPITLSWHGAINEDNEVEVFSRWNTVPSTKMLSFYKREPLTIEARYSYPNDIPYSESKIGQYCIENIQPQPDGTPSKIKVKVRLNRNGIFDITQALLIESVEEEAVIEEAMDTDKTAKDGKAAPTPTTPQQKPAPQPQGQETNGGDQTTPGNGQPLPTDTGDAQNDEKEKDDDEGGEKKGDKTKKKSRKKEIELPITSRVPVTSRNELDRLIEAELDMISQDKKEKERSDAKNAVEEYVYDMRGKLDGGEYEKYSDDKHKQQLLNDLRSTEDWLYDEGMNQEKNVYVDRLKGLKNLGDPIKQRYTEAENRTHYFEALGKSLQRIDEALQQWRSKNEKYSHIEQADIEKVHKYLNEKQQWYDQSMNRVRSQKLSDDPQILCSQIKQEREALDNFCWPILNKPKPKVELPKDDEKKADNPKDKKASPSKNQNQQQQQQGQDQQQPQTSQSSMEVD